MRGHAWNLAKIKCIAKSPRHLTTLANDGDPNPLTSILFQNISSVITLTDIFDTRSFPYSETFELIIDTFNEKNIIGNTRYFDGYQEESEQSR